MTNSDIKKRLVTEQFALVMLLTLMIFLVHFVLIVSTPLYILKLGGSNSGAGLSTGLYSLTALIFRPLVGHLLDNSGRKKVLFSGLIMLVVGILLMNVYDSIILVLSARIIQGIGFSITSTAAATLTADVVPRERLSEGMGYYGVSMMVTNSLGPLLGLIIAEALGYKPLFLLLLPLLFISAIAGLFLKSENFKIPALKEKLSLKKLVTIEKSALPASSMMIFASLSYGAIITFLAPFAFSRGIEDVQFFFIIYPAAVIFIRMITGRFSDRINPVKIIIPSIILASAALLVIYGAHTVKALAVASCLYGLGYGTLQPILNALAVKNCAPENRGAANATFFIAFDLGIGAGSIILGFISKNVSFSSIYVISAVSVAFSLVLFLVLNRPERRKN